MKFIRRCMMETRYTVRQAVDMTGVKSYVLRYWEEELELRISRNELGHRYYTGYVAVDVRFHHVLEDVVHLVVSALLRCCPAASLCHVGWD